MQVTHLAPTTDPHTFAASQHAPIDQAKVKSHLQYLLQDLGGFQKINNKRIFFTRKETTKSLKRLSYDLYKPEEVSRPYMRLFLLEWGFVRENLLPILITQQTNKELMFQSFRLLWIFTSVYEASDLEDFEFKTDFMARREGLRELLYNEDFMSAVVREIEHCAAAGDSMLDVQKKMITFAMGTILNLLQLDVHSLLPKILKILNKDSGFLDALIFFAENKTTRVFQQYYMDIAKIISNLLGPHSAKSIFGPRLEKDPEFRRRVDLERLSQARRKRNVVSSRHSRFGAMISVRRSDNTTAIVSNPNALRDKGYLKKLEKRGGQLKKRVMGLMHQSRYKKGDRGKALGRGRLLDASAGAQLRRFLKELFEYGFGNLLEVVSEQIFGVADGESYFSQEDTLLFVKLVTFGIECALVMR